MARKSGNWKPIDRFLRPNAPVFNVFPFITFALDCLLDDKGSVEPTAFFSAPLVLKTAPSLCPFFLSLSRGSFYFAEPRACRRIIFRCRVGFIARTPVLLTARYYRASLSPCFREPSRDETSKYIARPSRNAIDTYHRCAIALFAEQRRTRKNTRRYRGDRLFFFFFSPRMNFLEMERQFWSIVNGNVDRRIINLVEVYCRCYIEEWKFLAIAIVSLYLFIITVFKISTSEQNDYRVSICLNKWLSYFNTETESVLRIPVKYWYF